MADQCPTSTWRIALVCASIAVLVTPGVFAQSAASTTQAQLPALKQLTLEELLDVDVKLPLRRPERAVESAAAVSVLTDEDIW